MSTFLAKTSKTEIRTTFERKILVQTIKATVIIKTVAVDSQPLRQKFNNPDFIILLRVVNIILAQYIAAGILVPYHCPIFQAHHPALQSINDFLVVSRQNYRCAKLINFN